MTDNNISTQTAHQIRSDGPNSSSPNLLENSTTLTTSSSLFVEVAAISPNQQLILADLDNQRQARVGDTYSSLYVNEFPPLPMTSVELPSQRSDAQLATRARQIASTRREASHRNGLVRSVQASTRDHEIQEQVARAPRICNFLSNGRPCPYGDGCQFSHDVPVPQAQPFRLEPAVAGELRQETKDAEINLSRTESKKNLASTMELTKGYNFGYRVEKAYKEESVVFHKILWQASFIIISLSLFYLSVCGSVYSGTHVSTKKVIRTITPRFHNQCFADAGNRKNSFDEGLSPRPILKDMSHYGTTIFRYKCDNRFNILCPILNRQREYTLIYYDVLAYSFHLLKHGALLLDHNINNILHSKRVSALTAKYETCMLRADVEAWDLLLDNYTVSYNKRVPEGRNHIEIDYSLPNIQYTKHTFGYWVCCFGWFIVTIILTLKLYIWILWRNSIVDHHYECVSTLDDCGVDVDTRFDANATMDWKHRPIFAVMKYTKKFWIIWTSTVQELVSIELFLQSCSPKNTNINQALDDALKRVHASVTNNMTVLTKKNHLLNIEHDHRDVYGATNSMCMHYVKSLYCNNKTNFQSSPVSTPIVYMDIDSERWLFPAWQELKRILSSKQQQLSPLWMWLVESLLPLHLVVIMWGLLVLDLISTTLGHFWQVLKRDLLLNPRKLIGLCYVGCELLHFDFAESILPHWVRIPICLLIIGWNIVPILSQERRSCGEYMIQLTIHLPVVYLLSSHLAKMSVIALATNMLVL